MRVFEHPNLSNFVCPLCSTSRDEPVVLVGVEGTQEGNIMEAHQYHLDCLDLREIEGKFLFQKIEPKT